VFRRGKVKSIRWMDFDEWEVEIEELFGVILFIESVVLFFDMDHFRDNSVVVGIFVV